MNDPRDRAIVVFLTGLPAAVLPRVVDVLRGLLDEEGRMLRFGTVTRNASILLLLAASGCGDDTDPVAAAAGSGTTGGVGGAGSTSTSGTGGTGGMGGTGGSGGSGGSGGWTEAPVVPACASPTITPGATWMAAPGQRFSTIRLAARGDKVGIAYAESTGPSTWQVKLQRLDLAGQVDGPPVSVSTIDVPVISFVPVVSVATDGLRFLLCFDSAPSEFGCSIVDSDVGASAGVGPGESPSVAFGPAGFGQIYGNGSNLVSQALDVSGTPVGDPHVVLMGGGPYNPKLTATSIGYASLETATIGILHRFDASFAEEEGNTVIGWPDSPFDIAGSGPAVGTIWLATGAPMFRRVDGSNDPSDPVQVNPVGASSVYSHVAITGGDDSYAAVWSAFEGYLAYRAIDGAGVPQGEMVEAVPLDWNDNPVAIAGVSNGFMVAGAAGITNDTMKIAHLGCPP